MDPFLDHKVGVRSPVGGRASAQPALVIFLVCLVLGLATVAWRAKLGADNARARARVAALSRGEALELQFSQALSAAEVLGALARQCGGAVPSFQKVAAELLAARPGLASLELQPNGVVSDIVPRAGNERAIGFNVLNDPVYRPGADAAIKRRVLTVVGPLALYHGEPGIVARVPVFLRNREGRDYLWGFVAVSMRLSEALSRARVDELASEGYHYAFFAPGSAKEKAVAIAARGALPVQSAVLQSVRARELEFRLALLPRGGWINKSKLVLESLGALVASGLVCLLVNLLESRRAVEAALADANQRLAQETADRKQAREDYRGAKDEAKAARAELDRARSTIQSSSELEVRLNASVRTAEETARSNQSELDQSRMALLQGEQTIRSLQSRLNAAARAEKEAAAALQTGLEAAQATIADLQSRLEAATREAPEAAEASLARKGQMEHAQQQSSAHPGESDVVPASSPPKSGPVPSPITSPDPDSPAPPMPEPAPTRAKSPPSQPQVDERPPRVAKRKKPRRDDQMDLFQAQTAPAQAPAGPAANAAAEEPTLKAPSLPALTPPVPPAASAADESETPAAAATKPILTAPKTAPKPNEEKPARRAPAPPPVDPSQLRKAVNQILPLFTGQDPGARDCLKANRSTFRSAFAPEAYAEFEHTVKNGGFTAALEQLKKAAKRHGIPV